MGVGDWVDTDNIVFPYLAKEVADNFVKTIVADFDAVSMANGFGANFLVDVLGGHFQRGQGFLDQTFGWSLVDGHAQVHFDFGGGRGSDGVDGRRSDARDW